MTSEELRELAASVRAGNHAGTVDDPIPQQLLYTKTDEDGTKKVYTVAAGIAVSGGTGSASPATDTVMGIVKRGRYCCVGRHGLCQPCHRYRDGYCQVN